MTTKLINTWATSIVGLVLFSTLILQPSAVLAQGTAFVYQGHLTDSSAPANGLYDFKFTIFDSSGGPTSVGSPITTNLVPVTNGLFTVALDFGAGVFTGPDRYLEIGVRTNGPGALTTLSPREKIAAVPYAILAGSISGVIPN